MSPVLIRHHFADKPCSVIMLWEMSWILFSYSIEVLLVEFKYLSDINAGEGGVLSDQPHCVPVSARLDQDNVSGNVHVGRAGGHAGHRAILSEALIAQGKDIGSLDHTS